MSETSSKERLYTTLKMALGLNSLAQITSRNFVVVSERYYMLTRAMS